MRTEQEVRRGLGQYKRGLIRATWDNPTTFDPEDVRRHLRAKGVHSTSPIVVIPYDIESLDRAAAVADSSEWQDPFVVGKIKSAKSKRKKLDKGASIYDIGFPTVFYTELLDLAVVIDDSKTNEELFGEIYSRGALIESFAHELTHSAFAPLTVVSFSPKNDSDKVRVKSTHGIGQASETVTLSPGAGTENLYKPVWIDEAHAVKLASEVRGNMVPESVQQKPCVMEEEEFGIDEIEIPPPYLIFSESYPDEPGDVGGSVAGVGLDTLETKRPGLIRDINNLTTGGSIVDFHNRLKHSVGKVLYKAITTRQPYKSWGNVLDQILDLSPSPSSKR